MQLAEQIARSLVHAMLSVPWQAEQLAQAATSVLPDAEQRVLRDLIRSVLKEKPFSYPPSPDWLLGFFSESWRFDAAITPIFERGDRWNVSIEPAAFAPHQRFVGLDVPILESPGDLAQWIDVSLPHLDWMADTRRQATRTDIPILQNYRYRFVAKRSGPPRLLEEPKPLLKSVQRRILSDIVGKLPAHDAAHGYVAGRSCLSGAARHAGEAVVVAADLKNFFPSTPVGRVHAIFRSIGYPNAVARMLTGLTTSVVPEIVLRRLPRGQRHDRQTRALFVHPHLPQGAPTSPALANLAAFSLDCRLAGLARAYAANYTRYADDLAFSGGAGLNRNADWFLWIVSQIARDEGYAVNPAKTRVMPRSVQQRVTGIVVNRHINIAREDYDRLKATLCNAVRHGAAAQNREGHADLRAHLEGRVGWVEQVNPPRGERLRNLLEQIVWE